MLPVHNEEGAGPDIASQPIRRRGNVLRQVMEARYRALLQSSSRTRDARTRHEAFLSTSEAYGEVFNRGDARVNGGQADHTGIGGLEWWVPPDLRRENGFADRVLRKKWLPLTDILLARELATGTVMLDIGANIGTTSIPRVVLGDFQYVYAAEPEPTNFGFLVHNVVANGLAGFVLPDRVAIGALDGEQQLHVSAKMTNHMLAVNRQSSADSHQVTVRCRTLDTWVREHGIDPVDVGFIKCDTQGWEGYVLRGAREILRFKHIAWQLEVWPKGLQKAGFEFRELCDLLRTHFTHFIDLSVASQEGSRVRPTAELDAALTDANAGRAIPDLLVYNADA